jgi:hypothetical protein
MKKLGIKRLDAGIYEVINHDWDASNGRLQIYRAGVYGSDQEGWRSSYSDSLFSTLSEAKASTFVALENDGLGVIA